MNKLLRDGRDSGDIRKRVVAKSRKRTVKLRTNGKHKVDAASTINAPIGNMNRILRPQARFQWLGPQLAAITPTYIEQTMIGAMAGSYIQAWQIFDLMLKTWPELLACYNELIAGVLKKQLVFEPYREEDEKPTPSAIEKSKLVSCAIRRMEPDPAQAGDTDITGTISDILDAWFRGQSVSEILWQSVDDPTVGTIWAPKSTSNVDPTNYGFNSYGTLGLRRDNGKSAGVWPYQTTSLNPQPSVIDSFPENRFLIAMHKASAGSQTGGALLRPLAWWWCAANFSSDWLLNLAQVFGLPFRWANYDTNAPQATIDAICTMLQNMGSNGWAAFPVGTTLEMIQAHATTSDHSPQGELLDRADRYARSLILGQTMTGNHGTTGKGGGQAFGQVETTVKDERIEAAGDFAAGVINKQFVRSILMLNYGDAEEMPTCKFLEDDAPGLIEMQRDTGLAKGGLEIGKDYLRKKYDIPEPAEGEETIGGAPVMPPGFGGQDPFGNQQDPNSPDQQDQKDQTDMAAKCERCHSTGFVGKDAGDGFIEPVRCPECQGLSHSDRNLSLREWAIEASGDLPGHEFHGNQWTTGNSTTANKKWDFTESKQIGEVTEPKPGLWKKTPGDFTAASQAAAHYAKKQGVSMQIVPGNSYGHKIYNIHAIHDDGIGKNALVGDSHRIGIVHPNGKVFQVTAVRKTPIESGDQTGHPFRGNQYIGLGQMVSTPSGNGTVVAQSSDHLWVSTTSGIKQFHRSQVQKIAKDKSNFPSITHSAENERRKALQMKIEKLNEIEDEAVFATELKQLAGELK